MKQFAIRRLYSYFTTTTEEIENNSFDERLEKLDEELAVLLDKYGMKLISHDSRFIPCEKMAATNCEKCDNLMINREINPARFDRDALWADLENDYNAVVFDGGTFEGKHLCMECLPISHRWGFFS